MKIVLADPDLKMGVDAEIEDVETKFEYLAIFDDEEEMKITSVYKYWGRMATETGFPGRRIFKEQTEEEFLAYVDSSQDLVRLVALSSLGEAESIG